MALKQTRKSVSLSAALYEAAAAVAIERGIPIAHLVADGLKAMGVTTETFHRPIEHVQLATAARHGGPAAKTLDEVARRYVKAPRQVPASFCAMCTSSKGPFFAAPLGKNNAIVAICGECDGQHPRSGAYAFDGGESVGQGIGEGNRRRGKGVGQ